MITTQQHQASNPYSSVWVAASAGTGKTKVLTDRVLRLLLEGVAPGKIVCLTYTNAAAAEMANRIQGELGKWVLMEEALLKRNLASLTDRAIDDDCLLRARKLFAIVLDAVDGLKIQTLHSFCQDLMRQFPLEAGIVPHFTLIEERVAQELILDTINQLVMYQEQLPLPLQDALKRVILQVYEGRFYELMNQLLNDRDKVGILFEQGGVEGAVMRMYECFQLERHWTKADIILDPTKPMLLLKQQARILQEGSKTDQERGTTILTWLNKTDEEKLLNFHEYVKAFLTIEGNPRKGLVTKGLATKHPDILPSLEREQYQVGQQLDRLHSLTIAQMTADILLLGMEILNRYTAAKSKRAMLDFNDLILLSKKLLKRPDVAPWILYKLDGGIDHLLIDEAQDTNLHQWEIIEALCQEFFAGSAVEVKNRTIFVVGDEKQSIYSFQGAEPKAFDLMHQYFAQKTRQVQKDWHSIALDRSFRSTAAVLGLVDQIFEPEALKRAVTFQSEKITHHVHRQGDAGRVELWPVVNGADSEDEILERKEAEAEEIWPLPIIRKEAQSAASLLAKQMAETIASWMKEGRLLRSKNRVVTPGDIMILVRRRNELVDHLIKYLKIYDVPVAGADRMILTQHIAVMDLIALGKFLLLPTDDLILATILKTPLFGFSEEDLFTVAYGRSGSLWDSLRAKMHLNPLFAKTYQDLSNLLHKLDTVRPFELFADILEAKNGRNKIIARLGEQASDPIDEFLGLALEFENLHIPCMQEFLHWLESGDVQVKRDMEQGKSQVRIMTVHGSKGLQAPIVFLPDTMQGKNTSSTLLWEISEKAANLFWSLNEAGDNDYCKKLRSLEKQKQADESLRLLYVALTRAEDELYIAAYGKRKETQQSWYGVLSQVIKEKGRQEGIYYVLDHPQEKELPIPAVSSANDPDPVKENHQDDFIHMIPPQERMQAQNFLRPSEKIPTSRLSEGRIKALLKGKVIHSLLQYLPGIDPLRYEEVIDHYLYQYEADWSVTQREEIKLQVLKILRHETLNMAFSADSRAEVPIMGQIGAYKVFGIVDRFVLLADRLVIIDYKTNHEVPLGVENVSPAYIKQMAAYRHVLQQIYPAKQVDCALLWTAKPEIMLLPVALMEQMFQEMSL